MTGFAHTQTTNKLVNEAANDFARVSGQDRKIPPALGTNQIAGFGPDSAGSQAWKKKLPYCISEVLTMFMFLCIHCFSGITLEKRLEYILHGLVSPFAVKCKSTFINFILYG